MQVRREVLRSVHTGATTPGLGSELWARNGRRREDVGGDGQASTPRGYSASWLLGSSHEAAHRSFGHCQELPKKWRPGLLEQIVQEVQAIQSDDKHTQMCAHEQMCAQILRYVEIRTSREKRVSTKGC